MGWLEDVGKVIPLAEIYRDVAQPATREVGELLGNAAKVARFALAPVDYLAAQHQRWKRYLERLAEKVPDERRIEAHPQLAGPVFAGLQYVEETGINAELFINLLARAIDRERVSEAHPAFAQLISQLRSHTRLSLGELMSEEVQVAKTLSIRESGYDEYWLQNHIYENPICLGLGELDAIAKERQQLSGGRLDILLKNPEDDSMYEVEIMLGETDETHIIRTIEYWDNEKRRWPQRQHFAVLVAEHINRRFFNVIHILSHSIPIIAIQAALLEANGRKTLFFTKVLDTFEEIDDGTSLEDKTYNRDYWVKRAKWTLESAEALLGLTQDIFVEPVLNYVKYYVAIAVSGNNYFWLHKRSANKSLLAFRMTQTLQDETAALLDGGNISYVKRPTELYVNT